MITAAIADDRWRRASKRRGARARAAPVLCALLWAVAAGPCRAADDHITVASKDGQGLSVKNFKLYPSTVTRPNMPGRFFLAGGLNTHETGAPYSIFYIEPRGDFGIIILKEPVTLVRQRAERDLLDKLGLAQDQICKLNVYVQVPYDVSHEYLGQNIGFTFCAAPAQNAAGAAKAPDKPAEAGGAAGPLQIHPGAAAAIPVAGK